MVSVAGCCAMGLVLALLSGCTCSQVAAPPALAAASRGPATSSPIGEKKKSPNQSRDSRGEARGSKEPGVVPSKAAPPPVPARQSFPVPEEAHEFRPGYSQAAMCGKLSTTAVCGQALAASSVRHIIMLSGARHGTSFVSALVADEPHVLYVGELFNPSQFMAHANNVDHDTFKKVIKEMGKRFNSSNPESTRPNQDIREAFRVSSLNLQLVRSHSPVALQSHAGILLAPACHSRPAGKQRKPSQGPRHS